MIPTAQTLFVPKPGPGAGNCLQACLASVLELSLDQVPNFAAIPEVDPDGPEAKEHWWFQFERWLGERNLGVVVLALDADVNDYAWALPRRGWALLDGKSPRGEFKHIVVAEIVQAADGTRFVPVWDPHPDGNYFDGPSKHVWLFINPDPARGSSS